jgi:hypothetical protein
MVAVVVAASVAIVGAMAVAAVVASIIPCLLWWLLHMLLLRLQQCLVALTAVVTALDAASKPAWWLTADLKAVEATAEPCWNGCYVGYCSSALAATAVAALWLTHWPMGLQQFLPCRPMW